MSGGARNGSFEDAVAGRVGEARRELLPRLFARDATLWPGGPRERADIADRLGWLDLPVTMEARLEEVEGFAAEVRGAGFRRAVLLGMGGSSLAPDVFGRLLGGGAGALDLVVLDSTDPRAVQEVEAGGDAGRTLFLVSSKSGTTVESNALAAYFLDRTGGNGAQFAAITDAGTPLQRLGATHGFRRVFLNPSDVGGRFSALSLFGLVPAALAGVDVRAVLAAARRAREECLGAGGAADRAARLGAFLATGAERGRDKLTLLAAARLLPFGAWVEQLVAESTGKGGKGVLPVVGEAARAAGGYGEDRVFVALGMPGGEPGREGPAPAALEAAGHPVLVMPFPAGAGLGAAFFEWEVATALCGAWLWLNPFDQPNVAESKANTDAVLARFAGGEVPPGAAAEAPQGLAARIAAWLEAAAPGGYVAILAYLPPTAEHDALLDRLRSLIGRRTGLAVTAGYGPRFLHSTGQLHKGGPPTGLFLQIESECERDVAVPGAGYSFGRLELAQALGDLEALEKRGRPVLRLRLRSEALPALEGALAAVAP